MNICAYCKETGKMTREHVIPSYMYKFQKELENKVIGWNEVAEKMIVGEHKVKDVCESCNNNILGSLDAYSKGIFEEAGLLFKII